MINIASGQTILADDVNLTNVGRLLNPKRLIRSSLLSRIFDVRLNVSTSSTGTTTPPSISPLSLLDSAINAEPVQILT
jgi:hypothetical protein